MVVVDSISENMNAKLSLVYLSFATIAHSSSPFKLILLWTDFWGASDWEVGRGQEPFDRLQCFVRSCSFTSNRSELPESDAVLFHIHQLEEHIPQKRPGQIWIFFMLESPGWSHNWNYKKWKGLFDWTMTYRRDSDIRLQYGSVEWRGEGGEVTRSIDVAQKRREVAWLVSNCRTQSRREEYVEQLQKYIRVDIYGRCGTNLTCTKVWDKDDYRCLNMISAKYFFYLSFENSLCKDYITEKFYKTLSLDVVPIVRWHSSNSGVSSGEWFIDTADFASPASLANYLHFLINNHEDYKEYLRHRSSYKTRAYFGIKHLPAWCELCEKLNRGFISPRRDISTWWSEDDCIQPKDLMDTVERR